MILARYFIHVWIGVVGGSVGGCGARAVSRKTPIYFMNSEEKTKKLPANTPGLQLYSSLKIHCSVLHMDVCATAAVTPIIMK